MARDRATVGAGHALQSHAPSATAGTRVVQPSAPTLGTRLLSTQTVSPLYDSTDDECMKWTSSPQTGRRPRPADPAARRRRLAWRAGATSPPGRSSPPWVGTGGRRALPPDRPVRTRQSAGAGADGPAVPRRPTAWGRARGASRPPAPRGGARSATTATPPTRASGPRQWPRPPPGVPGAADARLRPPPPSTPGAVARGAGVRPTRDRRTPRLRAASRARQAHGPDRGGHRGAGSWRLVPRRLQGIEPWRKARVQRRAQGGPWCAGTDLLAREHRSRSPGGLLVWQDDVRLAGC